MTKFVMQAAIAATVGAGCLALETALSPAAMALSFGFSFNNGGGNVTGIVRGLTDNATSAATSVEILSNTAGFGLGEYVGNPTFNSWTVFGGSIQSFSFLSFGANNAFPAVTGSSLVLQSFGEQLFAGGLNNGADAVGAGSDAGLTFTPIVDPVDPPPIPTPALLPGLVGLGVAALRKRQAAA